MPRKFLSAPEKTTYNGKMTVNIPAEQFYDAGNQMLMVGKFESGSSSVAFKNAMALAVITVKNIPTDYSKAVLTASDNEYLTGTATVTFGDNVSMRIGDSGQPSNKLTINFGENTATEKRFYFAIPAGTYANGLTMTLEGDNCKPLTVGTLRDDNNGQQFTPEVNEFVDHTVTLDDEVSAVQMVGTPEQLKEALAEGGSIKFSQGIELNENLNISEDTSIDLNGQNLNMGSNTIVVGKGKTLNLTNSGATSAYSGRAAETSVGITSTSDVITASKDSKIVIGEGVNLTTTGEDMCCIFVPGSDPNNIANNVTIESKGTLLATQAGAATIYVNGNVTSGTINISGGSVKHNNDVAIYIAGKVNLTISGNAEISGTTGVEIRAGELVINGATISTESDFNEAANGNGSTITGAAIAVSQHTTEKEINVEIKNGTFNGEYALYEKDLHEDPTTVSISVIGGIFNGEIYSENVQNFITGGTFTKASAFGYLADKASVVVGADMTLTKAIHITNEATIDLNGKTIENKTAAITTGLATVEDECFVFFVKGQDANLTINASNGGKVNAAGEDNKSDYNVAVWAMDNASVTINGGEFTNADDTDGDGCDLIYARDGATITINNGSFQSHIRSTLGGGVYDVLNCKDGTNSKITVNGGKFQNYVPSHEIVGNDEVVLGENKKVYIVDTTTEVTCAHDTSSAETWYEVK